MQRTQQPSGIRREVLALVDENQRRMGLGRIDCIAITKIYPRGERNRRLLFGLGDRSANRAD